MAITRTPMIDDDGSGTTGTVVNNPWKQELYDQIDAALLTAGPTGVWVDIPFDAGACSVYPSGTWTVSAANIVNYSYMRIGKTLWLAFVASSTTVAGAPSRLRVQLPGGLTAARYVVTPFNFFDGQAGPGVGYATMNAGGGQLDFLRDVAGNPWGAGATHLHAGNVVISIN